MLDRNIDTAAGDLPIEAGNFPLESRVISAARRISSFDLDTEVTTNIPWFLLQTR